jgi:N-acetylglutamate synthase-like GNAT family acetyltransferase
MPRREPYHDCVVGASRTTFREAKATDLDAVRGLLREADLPVEGLEEQFGPTYVVVESGAAIVAAGGLEVYGPYGLLRSVVVSPSQRSAGLGAEVVRNRLSRARRAGLRSVYLLTTTVPRFFEKLGFERVDRETFPAEVKASREFSDVCPQSAVAMQIRLVD